MKTITVIYILNSTLLLLHEIESAYEREWEILKLPGKITGFLLMHVPIIVIMFYGLIALEKNSTVGFILGFVFGIGGILPFLVHKLFVKRIGHFDRIFSDIIIYLNVCSGAILLYLTAAHFA